MSCEQRVSRQCMGHGELAFSNQRQSLPTTPRRSCPEFLPGFLPTLARVFKFEAKAPSARLGPFSAIQNMKLNVPCG
jgi:hypothetical protein